MELNKITGAPKVDLIVRDAIPPQNRLVASEWNLMQTTFNGNVDILEVTVDELTAEMSGFTADLAAVNATVNAIVLAMQAFDKVIVAITPEYYGALGDGVNDDTAALNAAANEARFRNVPVTMSKKTYLTTAPLDMSNVTMVPNGGTIQATNSAGLGSIAINVNGSVGTYYPLTDDLEKGGSVLALSIPDLTTLNLAKGDLIKIKSDKIFAPASGEMIVQGEMQKVYDVNLSTGEIYLFGYLEDSYLVSDVVKVAKVTPARFKTVGRLNIIQDTSYESIGIFSTYTEDMEADVAIEGAFYISYFVSDGFNASINLTSYGSERSGAGYGVMFANATMYSKATGFIQASRHAITTGGNAQGGVSWGSRFYNITASNKFPLNIFDTHAACGSAYFVDCRAMNGTGHDGLPVAAYGFKSEARETHYVNCIADGNYLAGLVVNAADAKRLFIENFVCDGALNSIVIGPATAMEFVNINNVTARRKGNIDGAGNALVIGGTHANIAISNFMCYDIGGVAVSVGATMPPALMLESISVKYVSPAVSKASSVIYSEADLDGVTLSNCRSYNAGYLALFDYSVLDYTADNCYVEGCNQSAVIFQEGAKSVTVRGGRYREIVINGYFILSQKSVGSITVIGVITEGVARLRGIFVAVGTGPNTLGTFYETGNKFAFATGRLFYAGSVSPTVNNSPVKSTMFTVSGSGQTTINIPHGWSNWTPGYTCVIPKSADAVTAGIASWTEGTTNITITLKVAAGAGTNNLVYCVQSKL